jgi:hypothetical protein
MGLIRSPERGTKMKTARMGFLGVIAVSLIIVGIVAIIPDKKQSGDTELSSLIAQEERLNDQCRDGPGANAAEMGTTLKICDQRDKIVSKITALGWCWGKSGQIEADKKWEPCVAASQTAVNDTVKFDPNEARRKEILEEIYADTRSCMFSMARRQLMMGNKSRSDILSKMIGYCGNRFVGMTIAYRNTKWFAGRSPVSAEDAKAFFTVEANRQLELASQ